MRRRLYVLDPALSIAAGQMPAQNATPWFSDEDGVGSTSAGGIFIDGHSADEAVIVLEVSNWDGVTRAELVVQRAASVDAGAGAWARVDPPLDFMRQGGTAQFVDVTGGKALIKSELGTEAIALRVPLDGAKWLRFGFRAGDANSRASFAATAALELWGTR